MRLSAPPTPLVGRDRKLPSPDNPRLTLLHNVAYKAFQHDNIAIPHSAYKKPKLTEELNLSYSIYRTLHNYVLYLQMHEVRHSLVRDPGCTSSIRMREGNLHPVGEGRNATWRLSPHPRTQGACVSFYSLIFLSFITKTNQDNLFRS
jgi:hypothetical protein